MFDVYWRERGIALERSSRRNAARAQQIIDELAEERNAARERADVWQAHYIGLHARAEFLLEELDKAHGGAFFNPVRMLASDDITVPRGQREGQPINISERVYLETMNAFIKEKRSYLGGWRKVVKKWNIFGATRPKWKEDAKGALNMYEHYAEGYAERAKQELQARRAAQADHQEQPDPSEESGQGGSEEIELMESAEQDKPSE
jgi:hypothetical protein